MQYSNLLSLYIYRYRLSLSTHTFLRQKIDDTKTKEKQTSEQEWTEGLTKRDEWTSSQVSLGSPVLLPVQPRLLVQVIQLGQPVLSDQHLQGSLWLQVGLQDLQDRVDHVVRVGLAYLLDHLVRLVLPLPVEKGNGQVMF